MAEETDFPKSFNRARNNLNVLNFIILSLIILSPSFSGDFHIAYFNLRDVEPFNLGVTLFILWAYFNLRYIQELHKYSDDEGYAEKKSPFSFDENFKRQILKIKENAASELISKEFVKRLNAKDVEYKKSNIEVSARHKLKRHEAFVKGTVKGLFYDTDINTDDEDLKFIKYNKLKFKLNYFFKYMIEGDLFMIGIFPLLFSLIIEGIVFFKVIYGIYLTYQVYSY